MTPSREEQERELRTRVLPPGRMAGAARLLLADEDPAPAIVADVVSGPDEFTPREGWRDVGAAKRLGWSWTNERPLPY